MSRDSMYFGIGSCLVISAGGMQILARKAAGTGIRFWWKLGEESWDFSPFP